MPQKRGGNQTSSRPQDKMKSKPCKIEDNRRCLNKQTKPPVLVFGTILLIILGATLLGAVLVAEEQYTSGDNANIDFSANQWIAQSWRLGVIGSAETYNFSVISLKLKQNTADSETVKIYIQAANSSGYPLGNYLAENTTILLSSLPTAANGDWVNITLNQSVSVEAYGNYSILATTSDIASSAYWRYDNTGSYAGGTQWLSSDSGSTWSNGPYANFDNMFIIFSGQESFLTTELQSPANDSELISTVVGFNATLTPTNTTLVNATLYIWNSTNDLVNQTTTIVTGSQTNTTAWRVGGLEFGDHKWNVLGCSEDFCVWDNSNNTFFYGYILNSINYTDPTQEGTQEPFTINLTYNPSLITNIFVNLIYNGTSYPTTKETYGNTSIFSRILSIPAVGNDTNFTFYWQTYLDETDFNTTTYQHTVELLGIDLCSEYNNLLFNFSVYDEETKLYLPNATIETSINVYDLSRTNLVLNLSNTTLGNMQVCLSSNVTSSAGFAIDAVSKYYEEDAYAYEYYNILNATLNASFGTQHIRFYDLFLNDTTEFEVSFTGDNFLPIQGALVYLDREYIGDNQFLTVEAPLTDEQGKTIFHMVPSSVRYNIRVIDASGSLVGIFNNIIPYCPNPSFSECTFSLSSTESENILNYNNFAGIIFSSTPIYREDTNEVRFDFIVPGGLTKLVNLNVTRKDIFGNRTICENSLNAASGTLACNVGNITDSTLLSTVGVNGKTIIVSTVEISEAYLGSMGFLVWFILSLLLILIFGESKNGVLISLILSYVGAATLGLSTGNIFGIGSAGVWIIVVTVLGFWRLNRERQQ